MKSKEENKEYKDNIKTIIDKLDKLIKIGVDLITLKKKREKDDLYSLANDANKKIMVGIFDKDLKKISKGLSKLNEVEQLLIDIEKVGE